MIIFLYLQSVKKNTRMHGRMAVYSTSSFILGKWVAADGLSTSSLQITQKIIWSASSWLLERDDMAV